MKAYNTGSTKNILPDFVDFLFHIESSILTSLNYSKITQKHGVITTFTNTHAIANVCGKEGVENMVANLMNLEECDFTARESQSLISVTRTKGCTFYSPLITMVFMSLYIIPELKIGNRDLFDVDLFNFINLKSN